MKKIVAVVVAMLLAVVFSNGAVHAGVNDFYFEDFTGDYYLAKDEGGFSRLKVVEKVTAVFPDFKQNKGICRRIPFTNQNGTNVTLPSLTRSNISVTRNGETEPIYSIDKYGDYYEVCTGTEEYVLGKQVYAFTYEFTDVIMEFDESGNNVSGQDVVKAYQELYWDTNGTDSSQRFDKVTARVHFKDGTLEGFTGESLCYVGSYGAKGNERCEIQTIGDGVTFSAKDLKPHENLTFDIKIKAGTFAVKEPERNYTLVLVMVGFAVVCGLLLILPFKNFLKTREKARFYNGLFVRPEYQPNKDYDVAEMAEIYIGEKKDAKVAVMLDMIVKGQIALIKGETAVLKRDKWTAKVKKMEDISREGAILLEILNGGIEPKDGDEIEIKTRTATSKLMALGRLYGKTVIDRLKQDGLVDSKYAKNSDFGISGMVAAVAMVGIFVMPILFGIVDAITDGGGAMVGVLVGEEAFLGVMGGIALGAIIIYAYLKTKTNKFLHRTEKGLEASRYMDGLKLYIKMAEKDRMAFLQSVKGADTSPEGVVHLYEKLLPYAAVLGLEKTWMKELEKYYQLKEVETPDWYYHNMASYSILSAASRAASVARSSTTMASSGSSSSSSSGFSGGGGGGFSGGGGGGGGFGGR